MKRLLVLVLLAVLSIPTVAQQRPEPTFPGPAVGASATALRQVFHDYWEWRLADEPELATSVGRSEYNDRWRDWSAEARERRRTRREEFLQQVLYIGTGNLTVGDRLSVHLLEHELRTDLETETYSQLTRRLTQMSGAHSQVFSAIDQMPARTSADYENVVARLRALPAYVDQTIALLQELLDAGLAQPAIVVDLTVQQIAAQRQPAALESPLLASFRSFPPAMPEAERTRLRAAAVAAYDEAFVPSWRRLETFLRERYQPRASIAVTSLPGGRALYDRAVRLHTTTAMTAEEIHQLGLAEVERLRTAMAAVARADGFTGTVDEYRDALEARPGGRFTSQQEMLAYARETLARVEPQLPRLFRRLPTMAVQIRPIPPDREASTASNYQVGTPDGTRPAWFNMNTYRPETQPKYRTEALVLHETHPGHHTQSALAKEIEGLPEFRRHFTTTAYAEGWALYAESLGPELGVYREPSTRFGQLASEQFRAVRLVVDTGMHAMGWTRDRARDYFAQHAPGQSLAEIDRYIAWPGQALAYKVGELKITELRRRAEQALGSRFDVREFHDVVLREGRLPLDLLEERVDAYIASAK